MNPASIEADATCPSAVTPSGAACSSQRPCPPRAPRLGAITSTSNAPKPCPPPQCMSSSPAKCCAPPSPCSRMDKNSFPQVFNPLDTNHRIFRGDDESGAKSGPPVGGPLLDG